MMATKKFDNELNVVITPKSKNTTYAHKTTNFAPFTYDANKLGFEDKYSYPKTFYIARYSDKEKSNKDLDIKTVFLDYNNTALKKIVTTRIKNYYLDDNIGLLDATTNCTYAEGVSNAKTQYILTSSDKDASLELNYGGSDYVLDEKGNDNYTISSVYYNSAITDKNKDKYENHGDTINDFAGNDTYTIKAGSKGSLYDYKGNDKYYAEEDYARLLADDYKGNDTYNFSKKSSGYVDDYAGNDKYFVLNKKDNDVDFLKFVDYTGKDYYEIKNSEGVYILESAGSDKYVVENCTNLDVSKITTDLYIEECCKSNDKYYFTNVSWTKYDNSCGNIRDEAGNDKYTMNKVGYLWIEDEAGNDKYGFTDSSNVKVSDNNGNDGYDFTLVTGVDTIDNNGKDSYNLTQSSGSIVDKGVSKDGYKIDKLELQGGKGIYIRDEGGKDTLTVSNLKKEDIVFMSDNRSLIIYDKTNGGYVEIDGFYKDDNNDREYEGFGDGRIETIKANGKTLNNIPTADYFTKTINQQVATWLSNNGCAFVTDAIEKGHAEDLIQIFNPPQVM